MIQNLHFEKVSIWLQIDRNPYMVADNREHCYGPEISIWPYLA